MTEPIKTQSRLLQDTIYREFQVEFYDCDEITLTDPFDFRILAASSDPLGPKARVYPVTVERKGVGIYTGFLPVAEIPPVEDSVIEEICDAVGILSDIICFPVAEMSPAFPAVACASMEVALYATVKGAPLAPILGKLCLAGSAALYGYCSAYNAAGAPYSPGSPHVFVELCKEVARATARRDSEYLLDVYFPEEVTMVVEANFAEYSSPRVRSAVVEWVPKEFNSLTISVFSHAPVLEFFDLVPQEDVPPDKAYKAKAVIRCPTSGIEITISLHADDGFSDGVTCSGVSECYLSGPWSEQGVTHTVDLIVRWYDWELMEERRFGMARMEVYF